MTAMGEDYATQYKKKLEAKQKRKAKQIKDEEQRSNQVISVLNNRSESRNSS